MRKQQKSAEHTEQQIGALRERVLGLRARVRQMEADAEAASGVALRASWRTRPMATAWPYGATKCSRGCRRPVLTWRRPKANSAMLWRPGWRASKRRWWRSTGGWPCASGKSEHA